MTSTSRLALVFDLDGTWTDTRFAIYIQMRDWAVLHRAEVPSYGQVMRSVHRGSLADALKTLFPLKFEEPVQAESAVREINRSYVELYMPVYAQPIDGATDFLRKMSAKGHKIAVVSNGSRLMVNQSLKQLGLSGVVDCAFSADDVPRPKPDPIGIAKAMECLDAKSDQTLYVGDTPTDIAAGKSAHVTTVGVLSGIGTREELQKAGADFVVRSVSDLGFIVRGLERR